MKITFIKPNIGRMEHSLYIDEGRMEPLQLGVLAALTDPDVEIKMYDDRMEKIPYDEAADLAAITVETYTARRSYEISAEYQKRDVPVILGGIHPTLFPEESAQHADSIYLGDAEFMWKDVVRDLKNNQLKKIYNAPVGTPQPGTITQRDIFKNKGYLPFTLLQFGRGCRFACNYCAISRYFKKTQYIRKIDEILMEIDSQKRKLLFFVDDNIISNKEAAKELFRQLIPMKIKWVSQGSIDMTSDPELMDLMARSGCIGNVIGFESLEFNSLKDANKSPNFLVKSKEYKEQVKIIRDFGLQTWGAFLLGLDHDTIDSIKRTLDFAMSNNFAFAAFNILMPYPNTKLYEQLKSENRLLYDDKWWLHHEYRFNHAAFIPKNMTHSELSEIGFYCRSQFNSIRSIIKRAFDLKTNMKSLFNLGLYLAYNPLFRKETFKKQDMKFGLE